MNSLFKIVVALFCLAWITKEVLLPVAVAITLSGRYMDQVIACDHAMEAHWYGNKTDYEQKAAEIQLLDCHNYDETRKLMLTSGLAEDYLSWLGLRALDIHQRPTQELTDAHKFRNK